MRTMRTVCTQLSERKGTNVKKFEEKINFVSFSKRPGFNDISLNLLKFDNERENKHC